MSKYVIDSSTLTAIANAIRYAEDSSGNITVSNFATRIRALKEELSADVVISYSFDNNIAGNASGIITLVAENSSGEGDYSIMWGDADGIMSNYSAINSSVLPLTESESVTYSHLISVNAIPKYATRVLAVKNGEIKASYDIPSNKLWSAGNYGNHLYSVELLSDVHYQYESGSSDWQTAFEFGRDRESVSAICLCGDLTDYGTETSLNQWKTARDNVRGTTPVYSCNGNHEVYNTSCVMISNPNNIRPYLDSDTSESGLPYFYKTINNDIYVFVACFDNQQIQSKDNVMFTDAQLTWLENVLETYRNHRVFLFQHVFPYQTTQVNVNNFANANNVYTLNLWQKSGSTMADRFKFLDLMKHYKNVIWFSGHSHLKWYLQEVNHSENYFRINTDGARFIHLPSLTVPRDIEESAITEYIYADSEGALLDVYQNCVIIRGRNFVDEKYLGIASYLLDTTPVTIPAKEVTTPTLSSISATKTTTSYNVGDTFVYSDIVVTATYSDGSTSNVTTDATIDTSNVNMASANTFTVPISYTEGTITKTTSISITVSSVEPQPTVNPTVILDATYVADITYVGDYATESEVTVTIGTKKTQRVYARNTSAHNKNLYYRLLSADGVDEANKVGFIGGVGTSYSANVIKFTDYTLTNTEWTQMLAEDGSALQLSSENSYLNLTQFKASSASTATFPISANVRIQIGYVD